VLVLLVQALLGLTLTAGLRAVAGPLHLHVDLHDGAGHHHGHHDGSPGTVDRHWHGDDATAAGLLALDGAAQAAEELPGNAAASAVAALVPAFPPPPAVPRPARDPWSGPGPAPAWTDAHRAPPEPPPRG
jgi:hypothetical protein